MISEVKIICLSFFNAFRVQLRYFEPKLQKIFNDFDFYWSLRKQIKVETLKFIQNHGSYQICSSCSLKLPQKPTMISPFIPLNLFLPRVRFIYTKIFTNIPSLGDNPSIISPARKSREVKSGWRGSVQSKDVKSREWHVHRIQNQSF